MPYQSSKMSKPGNISIRQYTSKLHPNDLADIHWSQPIQQRVWTLQERFVSNRIVLNNSEQLVLECASGRRFEHSCLDIQLRSRTSENRRPQGEEEPTNLPVIYQSTI